VPRNYEWHHQTSKPFRPPLTEEIFPEQVAYFVAEPNQLLPTSEEGAAVTGPQ